MPVKKTYAEWLSDRAESDHDRALTDAEQALFAQWYRDDAPAAQRAARRIVGADLADDVVHGAITRMMRAVVTGRMSSPVEYDAFRRRMLGAVRFLARNMVGGKRHTPPAHSQWAQTQAPISRRKVAERLLARDFESYTEEPSEATNAGVAYPLLPASAYRGPWGPQPDPVVMAQDLEFILEEALLELPEMQASAVDFWLEETPREVTSIVLRISPKTFDTHFARAKRRLREVLLTLHWMVPDTPDHPEGGWHLSAWDEVFDDMELDRRDRKRAARIVAEKRPDVATVETPKAA